jgi:peptidoglycan/LPS O-acetylase OafA/YrhL
MRTRGHKILSISLFAMIAFYLAAIHMADDRSIVSEPLQRIPATLLLLSLLSAVMYCVGFDAVREEKGYPGVMSLLVFSGFIGLVVIVALPDNKKKFVEPDAAAPQ